MVSFLNHIVTILYERGLSAEPSIPCFSFKMLKMMQLFKQQNFTNCLLIPINSILNNEKQTVVSKNILINNSEGFSEIYQTWFLPVLSHHKNVWTASYSLSWHGQWTQEQTKQFRRLHTVLNKSKRPKYFWKC